MSIATEITRLQTAKADLKTAIEGKGVTVPSATLIDGYADLVEDIPSGGGDAILRQLKNLGTDGFRYKTIGESVFFESLTYAGERSLASLTDTKILVFPILASSGSYPFSDNSYLEKVDIGASFQSSMSTWFFSSDSALKTLIIRKASVLTAPDLNCFNATPFSSGGSGGTLYVPQSLVASYRSASNWSTILGYANNSIVAIEGSQYENYYADGTAISS